MPNRHEKGNRVDENPSTSTRDVAREVQVSKTKVCQTLCEEGLYPFHVQRVQALQPDDFPARVRFCEWLLHQHDNNPDFLKCILVTDESTFTRNGVNNFRNTHVWSVENPHAVRRAHFQQTFLVNVWAGMVNEHFRAIAYYNLQRQLLQQQYLAELLSVFDNEAPHQSTIFRWYGEFKRGRVSLSDDPRVGAPEPAVTQENVDAVRKLIIEARHVTYREIEAFLKISKTSIQKILHEELLVRKLVSQQKAARVNWCQKTLDCFNSRNSKNVYSIVSGDKSWIYCYEPENKRQSAVWVFQGEENPTKVIRSRSVSKKIQRTVTADLYTTIYNASSHTAQKTKQYLTEENVELLDHPPHSPDLSPNDFLTLPKIKNRLHGQRFQSPEEATDAFKNAVLDLPANDWNKCFENWFERMQMCINLRKTIK
ncbi:unnamed protein product [Acanthoscelides obtectus]|uniref:Transposase n=1 Tax=Acanthoscelides obtectus TaxID=200917 RepID=A0A9P0M992_ACAOB|nr:unnamed protein product [Acanthoscelides obtectus]CAK1674087.1 Histone-lysine N-methyltransferase SETMAR [Acanthoscelides obtectus]